MKQNVALINGLLSLGHEVELLTSLPYANYSVRNTNIPDDKKLVISRAPQCTLYANVVEKRKKMKSALATLFFELLRSVYHRLMVFEHSYMVARKATKNWLKSDRYDVVISSSDPKSSHKVVHYLKKRGLKYNKWIQYWGDPMALDITNKSIVPSCIVKIIEFYTIKNADAIVYVSPFTYSAQCRLFPSMRKKMHFFPIPYYRQIKSSAEMSFRDKNKWIVGYYGDYNSEVRNILPLYEAFKAFEGSFVLHIVGSSDLELEKTRNVFIEPRQASDIIEQYELKSDILVCLLNRMGTQIPGKLYHCAATDKPVLVIVDGENQEEIEEYLITFNRFVICRNEVEQIRKTIIQITNSNKQWMPAPEFAPEKIAQDILDALIF